MAEQALGPIILSWTIVCVRYEFVSPVQDSRLPGRLRQVTQPDCVSASTRRSNRRTASLVRLVLSGLSG
jgi:hypothetical protein